MTNKNIITFIAVVAFSVLLGFYAGRLFERRNFRQRMFRIRQNGIPTLNNGGQNLRRNFDPAQRPNR
jgi:hypothetical protein